MSQTLKKDKVSPQTFLDKWIGYFTALKIIKCIPGDHEEAAGGGGGASP